LVADKNRSVTEIFALTITAFGALVDPPNSLVA
jgi:hypothetical protein